MLPKDYLVYRLSKVFCTDYSDASGTLLLNVKAKKWSEEMSTICGLHDWQLPKLCESYEVVGRLTREVAQHLGLSDTVRIVAGAGDNTAAAIGMGIIDNGSCNISLGTSGTIFIPQDRFSIADKNALHSFVHANGKWHLMGCILSAASCRRWWLENILGKADYILDEQEAASAETEELIFLPYLSGARSPHNDVNAKGAFIGLKTTTTRSQMSKAIMEGVGFALRDCLEAARSKGADPQRATICGGGAKSKSWCKIIADILGLPIEIRENVQGPSYGAALLAMVGSQEYPDVFTVCRHLTKPGSVIQPDSQKMAIYERTYQKYKVLYSAMKDTGIF